MGAEAVQIAEAHSRPEQRRSRDRDWRAGELRTVATRNGKPRFARMTWTTEDYPQPVAPPSGIRPEQKAVPARGTGTSVDNGRRYETDEDGEHRWFAPWELGDAVEESLLTENETDESPLWAAVFRSGPQDHYEQLAWRHGEDDEDDRPIWEQDLDSPPGPPRLLPTRRTPIPVLAHYALDPPSCQNPFGCDGLVKAKQRCGPCLEYLRTHRREERPLRLINRARSRGGS